jgi:hypothetical protein
MPSHHQRPVEPSAVAAPDSASVEEHHFGGDIEDVLHAATARALQMLLDEAERQAGRS